MAGAARLRGSEIADDLTAQKREYSGFLGENDAKKQVWLCLRFLSKKGLTLGLFFAILYKLSRGAVLLRRRTNLENDTEKREEKFWRNCEEAARAEERRGQDEQVRDLRNSQNSERVNACEAQERGGLWRVRGRRARNKRRIKHQSLILAQDERWRRA